MSDQPDSPGFDAPDDRDGLTLPALERRVRRLEDAFAGIQDTRQVEERVVQRLSERLALRTPERETAGLVIEAARHLLPAPTAAGQANGSYPAGPPPRGWLVFDMIAEARAMLRMYLDPRYKLAWPTRVVPPVLAALILTSLLWIPGISLLPGWLAVVVDKAVTLVLAYALFRVLGREARRYRETAPDLPPNLRP